MSGKKMRKLRKSLSMSSENHTNKDDLKKVNEKMKIKYAKKLDGSYKTVPVKTYQVVNPNLNLYRRIKKGKV